MPELPDITIYLEALEQRIVEQELEGVRIGSPFILRTFDPPLEAAHRKTVRELRRLGKRIAIGLEGDLWLVLHLMIAGRLHWKPRGARLAGKNNLAAFDFPNGTLLLTEAGSKRRPALYLLQGLESLTQQDPGGLEVLTVNLAAFEARSAVKTTLSSDRSPIRISSAASATRIPTKSCTVRSSRHC